MEKFVHLCVPEKFTPPLINFINSNFPAGDHVFLIGKKATAGYLFGGNVKKNFNLYKKIRNLVYLYKARKIFLHGLYDSKILYLLWLQPWLLKKCFWMIWGNDLYQFLDKRSGFKANFKEIVRKSVIKKIGHIVTYIKGDYELAVKWYRSSAEYHECLMYESNVVMKVFDLPATRSAVLKVLIGNSAYKRNNHFEVLDGIRLVGLQNFLLYLPLSYGPRDNAKKVAQYATGLFAEKAAPIFDFMPLADYLKFLENIDIAIFAQDSQQAMGNIINLVGMGKTVFLKRTTTTWSLFESLGLYVKDLELLDLKELDRSVLRENITRSREYFSRENLLHQYGALFE